MYIKQCKNYISNQTNRTYFDLYDKVCGVIFGQAIGDALGLGTEFMSYNEVLKYYPQKLTSYNQILQDRHRIRWKAGEWTDDTDMMLCIADAMIEDKDICLNRVAQNFKQWFRGTPMGIGQYWPLEERCFVLFREYL